MRSLLERWRRPSIHEASTIDEGDWPGWVLPRSTAGTVSYSVLPTLGVGAVSRITDGGMVVSASRRASVALWFGEGDRWVASEAEASVRQRRVEGLPIIESRLRLGSADVVWTAWADEPGDAVGRTVVEVVNELETPVVVGVAIRPFAIAAGSLDRAPVERVRMADDLIVVDGLPLVRLDRPPVDVIVGSRSIGDPWSRLGDELVGDADVTAPDGTASLVAMVPLTAGAATMLEIVDGRTEATVAPAPLDSTIGGWRTHLDPAGQIALPQWPKHLWPSLISGALAAANDPGERPIDETARIAVALASIGLPVPAADLVERLLDRAVRDRFDGADFLAVGVATALAADTERLGAHHGPAVAMAAAEVLQSVGDGHLRQRLLGAVAAAAGHRAADDAAEIEVTRTDPDIMLVLARAGAELALDDWELLAQLDPPPAASPPLAIAESFLRSARRLPTVIPDHLVAIRNAGGSTWRWHHGNDPDSALVRAALIIAMHRTAVDVHGGVVDLLPGFIEPWLGRPIDVSGLSTPMGSVSYALRWHGERPALLWEIEPTSADASVEIRASALDPSFSSTDRSGEVLLEVPPMAAGRLDEIRRSEP